MEEYCKSLREICGFRYVSQAIVMDPKKESVRYYLIFATNSLHGIEVFKMLKRRRLRLQDEVRYETRIKSEDRFCPLEDPQIRQSVRTPSAVCSLDRRQNVIEVLSRGISVVAYEDLYGQAMAFPLVTPDDFGNSLGR